MKDSLAAIRLNMCWSHRACAHSSQDYNNKKGAHKDSATFDNKMGGSTAYCGFRGERRGGVDDANNNI